MDLHRLTNGTIFNREPSEEPVLTFDLRKEDSHKTIGPPQVDASQDVEAFLPSPE
jgi:hypothetical protein